MYKRIILSIRYWLEKHGFIKAQIVRGSGNVGFDLGLVDDVDDWSWREI